jgi:hypothetical protein
MQPWPDQRSVLVVDNCRIHHNDALATLVRSAGMSTLVSRYPILNHHKDVSSSTCQHIPLISIQSKSLSALVGEFHLHDRMSHLLCDQVKAHFRHYGHIIRGAEDPIMAILDACGSITPENAQSWIRHAGYMW